MVFILDKVLRIICRMNSFVVCMTNIKLNQIEFVYNVDYANTDLIKI